MCACCTGHRGMKAHVKKVPNWRSPEYCAGRTCMAGEPLAKNILPLLLLEVGRVYTDADLSFARYAGADPRATMV